MEVENEKVICYEGGGRREASLKVALSIMVPDFTFDWSKVRKKEEGECIDCFVSHIELPANDGNEFVCIPNPAQSKARNALRSWCNKIPRKEKTEDNNTKMMHFIVWSTKKKFLDVKWQEPPYIRFPCNASTLIEPVLKDFSEDTRVELIEYFLEIENHNHLTESPVKKGKRRRSVPQSIVPQGVVSEVTSFEPEIDQRSYSEPTGQLPTSGAPIPMTIPSNKRPKRDSKKIVRLVEELQKSPEEGKVPSGVPDSLDVVVEGLKALPRGRWDNSPKSLIETFGTDVGVLDRVISNTENLLNRMHCWRKLLLPSSQ